MTLKLTSLMIITLIISGCDNDSIQHFNEGKELKCSHIIKSQ